MNTTYVIKIKTRNGWFNAYAGAGNALPKEQALKAMEQLQNEDDNEYKIVPSNENEASSSDKYNY